MDGRLHPKVHAFRSLADCDRLDAALQRPPSTRHHEIDRRMRRAVVAGAACSACRFARALTLRGVVTRGRRERRHLLSHQVGAAGGAVLARDLRRLGTEVYMRTARSGSPMPGPKLAQSRHRNIPGHRPGGADGWRTSLDRWPAGPGWWCAEGWSSTASPARLRHRRADPHDQGLCERRGVTTGFVPPAWEQAVLLARHLTGGDVDYAGTLGVARLRATGLEVAVLGDPENAEGDVVEMTNPLAGTYRKLVVRGGVLVAAALVGDLSRVGLITQLYDRRTVLGRLEPGSCSRRSRRPPRRRSPTRWRSARAPASPQGGSAPAPTWPRARDTTRATTGCGGCAVVRRLVWARAAARAREQVFPAVTRRNSPQHTVSLL